MTLSTHEADLKGPQRKQRPIHTQSLIVMAFDTEGDKTDQTKPSLKMSTFTAQKYSVLAFHPQGLIPKFHCWDWDLAKNQAGKWDLGKNWAGKWDLYRPSGPSNIAFLLQRQ